MQPIFVTGATGFLGAHLVCALLQKGYLVEALKRPQSSLNEFTFISGLYFGQDQSLVVKNLKWVDGDITEYDSIEEMLKKTKWFTIVLLWFLFIKPTVKNYFQ